MQKVLQNPVHLQWCGDQIEIIKTFRKIKVLKARRRHELLRTSIAPRLTFDELKRVEAPRAIVPETMDSTMEGCLKTLAWLEITLGN